MISVIIPAREEKYLEQTLRSVLDNARGEIEILVMLDGWLPDPQIHMNDDRVIFHHEQEPIGQRQSINKGARLARGEYVMKLDAHCAVGEGFDVVLARDCEYDMTMIGRMFNLDIETFKPKRHKRTDYMYIGKVDGNLRAQYYEGRDANGDKIRQPDNDKPIDDIMCCMGPCFFMHKKRFWELGGCDEGHGGWGQQGVEVSCKAWLSGGRLVVNKRTWFAHWFRGSVKHDNGKKGFPYSMKQKQVDRARKYSNDLWENNKWGGQVKKFEWLLDKFDVPNTGGPDITIIYITANKTPDRWRSFHMKHLKKATEGLPVITVSREPISFGKNIIDTEKEGYWNIYRQLLRAAKEAKTKYIAMAEDDALYTKEHFTSFRPEDNEVAYNKSRWSVFSWGDPIFSLRQRVSNCSLIAPRNYIIEALQERMDKYPNNDAPIEFVGEVGRNRVDAGLGVTKRKAVYFFTKEPVVQLSHPLGTEERQKIKRKAHGEIRAHDIPHWGSAKSIADKYNNDGDNMDAHKAILKYFRFRSTTDTLPWASPRGTRGTFAEMLAYAGLNKGVEVGVNCGNYSKVLCEKNPNIQLTCIDPWSAKHRRREQAIQDEHYRIAVEALSGYNVSFLKMTSMDAVKEFKDRSLDFAYIDGNHEFNYVVEDIIHWSKKVRKGGVIACHDYLNFYRSGVVEAVNAYTHCNLISPWFVTKEKLPTAFWVNK